MTAADFLPDKHSLPALTSAAEHCRGCDLYKNATQTVFGEGSAQARVMLIGEQPGDREDREGRPFVGPAGQLLDELLNEADLDRGLVYVTNAVKHFKWTPQGKRRLHKKPGAREIAACRPWLNAEMDAVHPEVLVCLGATAAQALLGRDFRISRQRGEFLQPDSLPWTLATWHPSAVLRVPDADARQTMRGECVSDFRQVVAKLKKLARTG